MNATTNPTNAYTVPSVSIATARTDMGPLFGAAQLALTIEDRCGHPVKPRAWFLVPLDVIDEAVRRILDGSMAAVRYDLETARLTG